MADATISAEPEHKTNEEATLVHEVSTITGLEWDEAAQLLARHNSNLEVSI